MLSLSFALSQKEKKKRVGRLEGLRKGFEVGVVKWCQNMQTTDSHGKVIELYSVVDGAEVYGLGGWNDQVSDAKIKYALNVDRESRKGDKM